MLLSSKLDGQLSGHHQEIP